MLDRQSDKDSTGPLEKWSATTPTNASLNAGTVEHPVGSAAVKEFYDGHATCTGCHSQGKDYVRIPYPLQ